MPLSRIGALGPCLCLCLAACAGPSRPARQPPALPPVAPPATVADPTPGFAEKEPDTCKAGPLLGFVGQPSGMVRTVRVSGPVRIIGPGTVYDQEEYRSDRINVFIDGDATIVRISCG